MAVEGFAQLFDLIVVAKDNPISRNGPVFGEGAVGFLLVHEAVIVEVNSDVTTAVCRADMAEEQRPDTHLFVLVFSVGFVKINHDVRTELLGREVVVFKAVWILGFDP